jgi:hypothetical protein
MAKEFVIKNGLIVNDTHSITGITNDSGLTYNTARIVTEDAIKRYLNFKAGNAGQIFDATKEPTGFPNRTDSILSISGTTFSIQPTDTTFDYWIKGENYISSGETIELDTGQTTFFIYFDTDNKLHLQNNFSIEILYQVAYTSVVYWDSIKNEFLMLGDERHGIVMDWETHSYLHLTNGTVHESGLSLGNFIIDSDGDDDEDARFSCSDGKWRDEDILFELTDGVQQEASPILYSPTYYRSGSTWTKEEATQFPVLTGGTGRLVFNENNGGNWTLTEVNTSNYVLCHIFATNDIYNPIISIIGQNQYQTIPAASEGANDEVNNLILGGLAFQEFIPIGTVIFQTAIGYSNSVKARTRITSGGEDYVNWIGQNLSPTQAPADHGALAGLGDDDHLQYVLLAGRSGDILYIDTINDLGSSGITIEGINISNGSITLESGTSIYDISTDSGFTIPSDDQIATTLSIKDYVDNNVYNSINTQIIFNNNGILSGSTGLTYDSNNVYVEGNVHLNHIHFHTGSTTPSHLEGLLFYESQSLQLYVDEPDVTLNIGEENWVKAKNINGPILNGSVVYISGSTGQNPTIGLADADDPDLTTRKAIGVATHDIDENAVGYVTTFGRVNGINTSGFSEGDELWLSTTPGGLTNIKPEKPTCSIFIGYVITSHTTNGSILVSIHRSSKLGSLSNVLITGATERQFITLSGNSVWYNDNIIKSDISDFVEGNYVHTTGDEQISGIKTFNDNVRIIGDLYVSGTTVTINTKDLNISDNIILLNSGETGSGVTLGTSGIQIDRGYFTDYQIIYQESDDTFRSGEVGSTLAIAHREDTPIDNGVAFWSASNKMFETDTNFTWDGSTLYLDAKDITLGDLSVVNIIGTGDYTSTGNILATNISGTTLYGDLDWSYLQNIKHSWQWDAGRNGTTASSIDLERGGGVPTNLTPFILPYDATIHAMSAGANTSGVWEAEVLVNGSVVNTLSITTTKNKVTGLSININADDEVRLRFNKTGGNINSPSISLFLISR